MAVIRCKKHPDQECYIVDWRPNGRNGPHPQRHFEGTEAEALAYWMEMVRLSRKERHAPVSLDPKVADLVPDWKVAYRNDHLPNTVRDLDNCLVPLMRHFGNMHLSELGAPIVFEQYKSRRLDTPATVKKRKGEKEEDHRKRAEAAPKISKRTIAKELSYFSGFLRWCNDHSYLEQPIRIRNFTAKQTTRKEAIRPLHRDDVTALVNAIELKYRGILLCMTDAGLRRSEALQLRAEQVDLRRRIIIVRGKGDKERVMVIASTRLHQELSAALEHKKTGYLFPNPKESNPAKGIEKPYGSIRKAILRAALKAGIDQRLYHHLMRHSFGTNAIVAGASLKAVQDMLGHVSSQTTQQYLHLAGTYFQDEALKLGAYFDPQPIPEGEDEDPAEK